MNMNMKIGTLLLLLSIVSYSCTKKYKDYNKNPYGVSENELERLPMGGSQLQSLQLLVVPQQENSYQMCFDLGVSGYAGYFTQFQNFQSDYPVYNPRSAWVDYIFSDTYPKIYTAYFDLERLAKEDMTKPFLAWGTVLRVAITSWLTDIFGPLPYSKMEPGLTKVAYDPQDSLYLYMCHDLVEAINTLDKVDESDRQYADFDLVYGGDMSQWEKYANSLLLRLSIRMNKQLPDSARYYGEMAIENGVITSNVDNALLKTDDNPVYKISATWANSCVNAEITEYMDAWDDPRMSAYFTMVESRSQGHQYFGARSGNPSVAFSVSDYSLPNLTQSSPIIWITAAEVAFLKAEASLNEWDVDATAEELYAQGVQLSFDQWEVGDANAYLNNSSQRGSLVDELTPEFNTTFSSPITVNWAHMGGDKEKKLSKIITQKWIAMFPYGSQEAWAEWRRTGYPNFMPAVINNSGGTVLNITQTGGRDKGGMQRLPYPTTEYSNNNDNINQAVDYLGGEDNGGTKLWWAK